MVKLARLDKGHLGDSYLLSLHELVTGNLINPSLDRSVTPTGQETLEKTLLQTNFDWESVNFVLKGCYFLQDFPDLSEMDAFVLTAAEVLMARTSPSQRQKIQGHIQPLLISEFCFYTLAAIKFLKDATEMGFVEVNPDGYPHDQCYIKYLIDKSYRPLDN